MNIRNALVAEHSKKQADAIARYIGSDPARFDSLMQLFFSSDTRIVQRASWAMTLSAERNPALIIPYLSTLLQKLDISTNNTVKRNTVRLLQFVDIPEEWQGTAADRCFELLATSSEPIAVKAFAMTVLLNITKHEPALKSELKILIENQLPYASAGFLSRARKVLKALENIRE
jgi:hypothetical protein